LVTCVCPALVRCREVSVSVAMCCLDQPSIGKRAVGGLVMSGSDLPSHTVHCSQRGLAVVHLVSHRFCSLLCSSDRLQAWQRGKRAGQGRDQAPQAGITKAAIRRLARRGGVKRISGQVYEETRGCIRVFLEHVLRGAITYTEHARRKTVTAMDVVHALRFQGRSLYGFGG
jgi:histone H4